MREDVIAPVAHRLAVIAREPLVSGPTPLDRAERLSAELNVELLIKRDDLTGLGLGGNKLRKLEFIVAQAKVAGVDTLLTTGGLQSNHARLTAAVAARAGMRCELFLKGQPTAERIGNLLLDSLFGATIQFCGMIDYSEIDQIMKSRAKDLEQQGRKAMVVPLGGANGHGTLGYVVALKEIIDQVKSLGLVTHIVVAGGTGSTAAGLLLGASLWAPYVRILVISASWSSVKLTAEIQRCVAESAAIIGAARPSMDQVEIDDEHVGPGYSLPSKEGVEAIRLVAQREGIVLDSTYTGKTFGGLLTRVRNRKFNPGSRVVFLHTGGTPEIFTRTIRDLGL
jgi:D-cysteine desulfhydrase family pyridoxal phosphate-dependent enzyme